MMFLENLQIIPPGVLKGSPGHLSSTTTTSGVFSMSKQDSEESQTESSSCFEENLEQNTDNTSKSGQNNDGKVEKSGVGLLSKLFFQRSLSFRQKKTQNNNSVDENNKIVVGLLNNVINGQMGRSRSESNLLVINNSLDSSSCSEDFSSSSFGDSQQSFDDQPSTSTAQLEVDVEEKFEKSEDVKGMVQCGDQGVTRGATLLHQGGVSSSRFKLILEGDLEVKGGHDSNKKKSVGSKFLRRWETHHLHLNDSAISSRMAYSFFSGPIPYSQIEDVTIAPGLSRRRFLIKITSDSESSLIIQAPNGYVRDQWLHSIIWKRTIFKTQTLLGSSKRPDLIAQEIHSLIEFSVRCPLQDDCISNVPIDLVADLLENNSGEDLLGREKVDEILLELSPLLERVGPPPNLCRFFARQCRIRPRSSLISELFTPVVRRALKHNLDFGKSPNLRRFIQDFLQALNSHNDGITRIRDFVKSVHGSSVRCPHPRVLTNLTSVCLTAMSRIFEKNNALKSSTEEFEIPLDEQLLSYLAVFDTISTFEDWRPILGQILQPVPFSDEALANPLFTRSMTAVVKRIGTDTRCEVHRLVLGVRDGKDGWFTLFSPSNLAYLEDFEVWGEMLGRLLGCCCRRKRFLSELGGKLLGSCLLLALREHSPSQQALCLLLEWGLLLDDELGLQVATTLQVTPTGKGHYADLLARIHHLKEIQEKGGPRKLTLPSRSTDADLAKLLSVGSFGNLECLSLSFTQVTSKSAEELIKLPALRYLNLWSTQFGDTGLTIISEHLTNLEVLNLCETPVTDKGLLTLTGLTNLKKLNLNSTTLSTSTYDILKASLPDLQEVDIRYTDAW